MAQNKPVTQSKKDLLEAATVGTGITPDSKEYAEKAKKALDERLAQMYGAVKELQLVTEEAQKVVVGATMTGQRTSDLGGAQLLSKAVKTLGGKLDQLSEIAYHLKQNIIEAKAVAKPIIPEEPKQTGGRKPR